MLLDRRSLLLICSTSACWAFSFGVGSQAVSHWLKLHDQSDTVVGLSHSFYYFGMAAGSCAVPMLTRWLGATWSVALGLMISGITLACFPWTGDVWAWYLLRFVNGWAGAMCVVPFETSGIL